MATKLRLKKSSVVGKKPEASDLDYGELAINYQDGNLYYKNADNDIKSLQESPVEFTAKNESGFPVTKGQAVYINGVSGTNPTIALADADNASAMPAFGLLKASANNNAEVIIITSGNLTGLDTSSFAVGDTLYVSTTPGAITNGGPPAGEASLIQNIGKVVRSHASEGIIKVGGAGRTAATPNLNSGNIFIGNDSNYASTVSMQTETRKHLVSGTGVGYDSASGVISIGQDVGTTSDVTFGKVTGDSGDFDIIKLNTTQWTDIDVPNNLPTFQEGNLFYFQGPDALTYSNHKINVKIGQDEIVRVYNNTGSTIAKGQAVYVTGATNDFPTIALARANSFNTVYETMGLTSNEILNGEFGYVTVRGLYGGLDTSTFSTGDIVHVSPDNAGTLVNFNPTYPNFAYEIGVVLVSDSATGGNVGGCIQINPHSEIFETLRGIGETRFDGDLTVAGSLTVLGSQTTVGQANVTQGAPFYRLNEGDAIGEAGTTFTGSGLDDAFFAGHFTGPSEQSYYVRIDGVGTGTGGVDTFKVALGDDSAFASPILTTVDITGSPQLIHSADNISVDFTATTGHTLNDTWKGTASPINVDTGFFTNRNTGTSGVGYTHMGFFFDVSDEKWKVIDEYDSVPTGIIEVTDSSLGILVADTFEGSFTGNLTGSASQFGGLNTTQFLRSDTADTKTSGDLSFSDNVKAVFGNGSDLQIYSDGANSIIHETDGTGNLIVRASNINLQNSGATATLAQFIEGGKSSLRYNNVEKLATTNTGIDVTGNMVGDGLSVSSGGNTLASTGNNLEFNRASGSSFIDQVGSGGSLTFRTTSSQTNRLKIENNGDINFYDSVGSGAELVWDTSALYLNAKDGVKSTYGDTNDLQIYHDGSNSYIDDQGTGRLYIKASDLYIQDDDADDMIRAEGGNNGVKLYHNGIQRLETTFSGIEVSGTVEGARGLFNGNSAGVTVDNTGYGAHLILMKNLEGSILLSHDDGALSINTGGAADGTGTTTAITVDSNQYVGIGVTSPTQVLDVAGNIAVSGTVDGRDIATDGTKLDTIDTNANNYSHPNHSGEVTSTGDGATVIADNVVDEANLKVSNSPTNGYFLSAQSGNTGGLTWAAVPPGYADSDVGAYIAGNRTYGNITTTGYIAGPSTLTIDPAGVGDNTGTLVIAGNLQVDGTTTTINSTTVTVDDLNLTLASGAANAAAANGAGITVDGASATITYDATNDEWDFNKDINVSSRVLVGEVKASANQTFTHGTGNTVNFRNSSAISRLFIKGDGDVGIGTDNPVAKLVVSKGGADGWEIDPGLIDSNHNRITNFNRATSQYCNLTTDALGFNYRISGSANAGLSMTANGLESKSASYNILNVRTDMDDNGSSDDGIIKITNGSSNTTKAELRWDESEDLVHISYGDHGRHISINSSGNVGIGTGSTSPSAKFHVENTAAGTGAYIENDFGWTAANLSEFSNSAFTIRPRNSDAYLKTSGSANDIRFQGINAANNASRDILFNPFGGNVGIGETSPLGKLHVKDGDAGSITTNDAHDTVIIEGSGNTGINIFSPNTSYQYLAFGDTEGSNSGYVRYQHSNNQMVLRTGGADTVYINDGNVGIGETSPSSGVSSNETTLHVSDANVPALVLDNTGNFGDKYAIYANTSGTLKFLNVDTNYTGIQITDNDTVKLSGHVDHTDGSRQMVGNISTSSTSQTALTSFTRHIHSGGEIMIIAIEATTERRHITKLLVIHDADGDNTSGPIATEYGTMATDGNLFSVDVDESGTAIRVNVTPTTSNSLTFRYKMDLLED